MGQIAQIKKMGNLKDLASMIPGMGKALKNVEISDDVFKQTEAIINSMTPARTRETRNHRRQAPRKASPKAAVRRWPR